MGSLIAKRSDAVGRSKIEMFDHLNIMRDAIKKHTNKSASDIQFKEFSDEAFLSVQKKIALSISHPTENAVQDWLFLYFDSIGNLKSDVFEASQILMIHEGRELSSVAQKSSDILNDIAIHIEDSDEYEASMEREHYEELSYNENQGLAN